MSDADVMFGAEATARAFVGARRTAQALTEYPGEVPVTLEEAYRIQDAAIRLHGGAIAGWKVGRIQPPLDLHFGTTRLAGPIFADLVHPVAPVRDAPIFTGGFGAVEAEFLFKLGTVPTGRTDWSIPDALDCVTAVHIGFEIASSPFTGINRMGPTVTASDFGNNNGLLVGPAVDDWQNGGIDSMTVTTLIDGAVVGTGQAASFPGGCGGSIAFLLGNLARRGIAIAPGTWVSTGAVTGVHEIAAGSTAVAEFGSSDSIACRIVAATPDTN
ncbi:2-keto-4-pentenoate hydratase [Sphingomonas sp. SUN039]|uniref:2-keto-4-pentenoate hydratase n=1 Tax=Sphingomonas sp. SUN039 TaxID=2937787 RepID=UPI00216437A5|nr:2-keto-4-pentenoate hydratase [Sphingomonas sp. SUN039]UVO54150.1 2-keto-4-pentenoate hydratase [Sphingomonas sp. SUN039]